MGRNSQEEEEEEEEEEEGADVDGAAGAVALGIRGGDEALCNILVAFGNGPIGMDWVFACVLYLIFSPIITVQ